MAAPWEEYKKAKEPATVSSGVAPWEEYAAAPKTSFGDAAIIGVQKGATLGTRPTIAGAGAAVGSFLGNMQVDGPQEGLLEKLRRSASAAGDAFSEARGDTISEQAKAARDQPVASIGGELAGSALTLPFTAAKGVIGGMKLGALSGAGSAIGESDSLEDAAMRVGAGAAIGGAVPLVMKGGGKVLSWAADKAGKGLKSGGKTAITAFLGPNREAIDRYLARADDVRGAKSVEEIKNSIDDTMAGFFDDVEKSKISKDEAKEALSLIEEKIKDTTREAGFDFRVKQSDIREALREARTKLDDAFSVETGKLSAIKSPIQLSDDVQTSIQDLKGVVSKGSAEAYEILGKSSQPVDLSKPFQALTSLREDLVIAGKGPVTPEAQGALQRLNSLIDGVGNLPAQMPAKEAKKLVQQIDSAIDYGGRTGAFTSETQKSLVGLRRGIDEQLKSVPGYADKMKEVAENAGLLSKASERFGDPRSAVSRLNTIGSRTSGEDRTILETLGSKTSRDFKSPVESFQSAQSVLKSPDAMDSIRRGLPQFSEAQRIEMASQGLSRPEALPQFVQGRLSMSGLPEQKAIADGGLAAAIQKLKTAQENLEPLRSLTPTSSQNAIRGLMKAPGRENIELRKTIEELSKMSGKDFTNWIADRRAAEAFNGEFRMGSRNVNFWGLIGGITGGFPGAGAGAAVGVLTDRFGPKMAQKILDGVIKIQGTPTVQKISSLGLSPEVTDYLTRSLVQAQGGLSALQEGRGSDAIGRRLRLIKSGQNQDQNEQ